MTWDSARIFTFSCMAITSQHVYWRMIVRFVVLNQDCVLHSIAERFGAITAHHRDSQEDDTGFSFVNCTIYGTGTVYLGRAWGNYSRAIYSYCEIDNIIAPSGWSDWNQPSRQKYESLLIWSSETRVMKTHWRLFCIKMHCFVCVFPMFLKQKQWEVWEHSLFSNNFIFVRLQPKTHIVFHLQSQFCMTVFRKFV